MNHKTQVREFMTRSPLGVDAETSLSQVQEMMRVHGVRHLPVIHRGKAIGVISDRSVKSAATSELRAKLSAADVMQPDPLTVAGHSLLSEVAAQMAEEKFGCVLVEDESGKLEGIFTTTDACRALRQALDSFDKR